jgi:hypothetical protein
MAGMRKICVLLVVLFGAFPLRAKPLPPVYARHYKGLHIGQDATDLPFPCEVVCEGQIGPHWVIVHVLEGKVRMFTVVYNGKKMGGDPVSSHTLKLLEALREHSYANSQRPFNLGMKIATDGSIEAWLDLNNWIVYEKDVSDPDKGITEVIYTSPDAPIYAEAKTSETLDKLAIGLYDAIKKTPDWPEDGSVPKEEK